MSARLSESHMTPQPWEREAERAARALERNRARIAKTKRGTVSSRTLEAQRRRKRRPQL